MHPCLLPLPALALLLAEPLPGPEVPIHPLDCPDPLRGLAPYFTQVEVVDHAGGKALRVTFQPADWPNLNFPAGDTPWDWSQHQGLALEVTNPGQEALDVSLRVDNAGADGLHHCNQQTFAALAPGTTRTLALTFAIGPQLDLWGMRGLPVAGRTLDPRKVTAFQIFLSHPVRSRTLLLANVRLFGPGRPLPDAPAKPLLDRFGQYNWADWPGKLHAEAEWPERITAEQADLAAHAAPADLDDYGGWLKGPQLEATGAFRTAQVAGKWWLVTPAGRLFFSMGMDCVRWHNDTIIEKRDTWLEWNPSPDSEFAPFFGRVGRVVIGNVKEGATFNFYGANLLRKYGAEWRAKWRTTTLARLRSWGFNTIANWSDPDIYREAKIPHVVTTGVGGNHRRLASGADYWGLMHDPFDPQFAVDARQAVDSVAALIRDNPWCIGLFVDNELSWGSTESRGLALGALNATADQPAKLALLDDLKRKYETVERLNGAWGSTCASWETMLAEKSAPKSLTPACKADLDAFLFGLATQYFTVVRDAVKAVSPRTLYLGCRFAWSSQAAIRAAAEVCDVVSFNIYQRTLDPRRWAYTSDLGKPCMIGEFHFGALDRGMFHTGLVATRDQADRAQHYIGYLHSVADLPAFVGCHWFQYLDQPCTGRTLDGENYNIGFVTMSDTPYPEMVAAARQVHGEIYARRYGAGGG